MAEPQEIEAEILGPMKALYAKPYGCDDPDKALAEYSRFLTEYTPDQLRRGYEYLVRHRAPKDKYWPNIAEIRAAIVNTSQDNKPVGRWLSLDEKDIRAKGYANGWLNTIDGQDLVESEPELTDWVFSWIVRENKDSEPEQVKFPTEKTYQQLRIKLKDFEEWHAEDRNKIHRETITTGRTNKLNRLKREGVYM